MKEQYNSVTYSELLEKVNKLEGENKELKETLSRRVIELEDIYNKHKNDVSALYNMIAKVYVHLHSEQPSVFKNILPKLNSGMNDPNALVAHARIMVDDILYGKHEDDDHKRINNILRELIENSNKNLNNNINKYDKWGFPYPDKYFEDRYRGYRFKTI